MKQKELFEDLPKADKPEVADPPHMAFLFAYKGEEMTLLPQDCRALFSALGNFLHAVEVAKNGRK
jgi:hypothetical protein